MRPHIRHALIINILTPDEYLKPIVGEDGIVEILASSTPKGEQLFWNILNLFINSSWKMADLYFNRFDLDIDCEAINKDFILLSFRRNLIGCLTTRWLFWMS